MDTTSGNALIRLALRANAAFSLFTGLLLALVPGTVGDWLGVSIDGWLRLLGAALIGHFALLVWAAGRPDVRRLGQLNLACIAPYPLMMIVLVATGLVERSLGQVLVLVDGAVVGSFALALWAGLRNQTQMAQPQTA